MAEFVWYTYIRNQGGSDPPQKLNKSTWQSGFSASHSRDIPRGCNIGEDPEPRRRADPLITQSLHLFYASTTEAPCGIFETGMDVSVAGTEEYNVFLDQIECTKYLVNYEARSLGFCRAALPQASCDPPS